MKEISLKQNAYYFGGTKRLNTEDGSPSISVISDGCYTALAEDSEGKEYAVYWKMTEEYKSLCETGDAWDEGDACDWENPYYVEDENGKNVTEVVTIVSRLKEIADIADKIADAIESSEIGRNDNANVQQTQETSAKYFNKHSYGEIKNKSFITCDAKTAYEIGQKAQEQGVTFSAKFDGDKSSIVVDGVKDKAFVEAVRAEYEIHDEKKEPTFYNKKEYKNIQNKKFINTDAKTAYAIGQKAQEQGVTFSAKFDGDKSAVTVDGVKDKAFVDAVKAEFNIVDKLDEVADIADKISDAIENGEIGKEEQSKGQER